MNNSQDQITTKNNEIISEVVKLFRNLKCQSGNPDVGTQYVCQEEICNERLLNLDDCTSNMEHIQSHGKKFTKIQNFLENFKCKAIPNPQTQNVLLDLEKITNKLKGSYNNLEKIYESNTYQFFELLNKEEEKWKQMINSIFKQMKLGFKQVYAIKLAEESKTLEKIISYCNNLLGFYNDGQINELNSLLKEDTPNYDYIVKKIDSQVKNYNFDGEAFRKNVEKLNYVKNVHTENVFSKYNFDSVIKDLNEQRNELGNSIGLYIINQSNGAFLESDLIKNDQLPEKILQEVPFKNDFDDSKKIAENLSKMKFSFETEINSPIQNKIQRNSNQDLNENRSPNQVENRSKGKMSFTEDYSCESNNYGKFRQQEQDKSLIFDEKMSLKEFSEKLVRILNENSRFADNRDTELSILYNNSPQKKKELEKVDYDDLVSEENEQPIAENQGNSLFKENINLINVQNYRLDTPNSRNETQNSNEKSMNQNKYSESLTRPFEMPDLSDFNNVNSKK